MLLEIDNIQCCYQKKVIIDNVSLCLREGELACLIGPSGCGKTTLLRAIAGFIQPCAGSITLRQQLVANSSRQVLPEKRCVGMVFQDYALFPHLSVHDNIAFGLRQDKRQKTQRVNELLALVNLPELGQRFPHELSGGQQQRVALARALAPEPDLVLLDEPFSSLDVELRTQLCPEVRDILKAANAAAILVTHDQQEAFAFAKWVGVLNEGQLLQWDTPYQLYHEPNSRFIANFIGQGRIIEGTLITPDIIQTSIGAISGNRTFLWPVGTRLEVLLRPDDIVPISGGQGLKTTIINKAFKGSQTLYTLRTENGIELLSFFPSHDDHPIGAEVLVDIQAQHLVAFPE